MKDGSASTLRFLTQHDASEFTGERYLPNVLGPIRYEHFHRYLFATELSKGLRILDIACGEGYGSALLAEVAAHVVGVDVDAQVLQRAANFYAGKSNLEFRHGNATSIPAPNDSFDVIVSFETLEHFEQHEEFMLELRRVLRPGGLLIISTPNRPVFSAPGAPPNEFHVRELDREEFVAFLRSGFGHYALYNQKPTAGSILMAENPKPNQPLEMWVEEALDSFRLVDRLTSAVYFVALASDNPLPCPPDNVLEGGYSGSLYEESRNAQIEAFTIEAVRLNKAIVERDEKIGAMTVDAVRLNDVVIERDRRVGALTVETVRLTQAIMERNDEIEKLNLECVRLNKESLSRGQEIERLHEERDRLQGTANAEDLPIVLAGLGTENEREMSATTVTLTDSMPQPSKTLSKNNDLDTELMSVVHAGDESPVAGIASEDTYVGPHRLKAARKPIGLGSVRRFARGVLRRFPAPLAKPLKASAKALETFFYGQPDAEQAGGEQHGAMASLREIDILDDHRDFRSSANSVALQVVVDASANPLELSACLASLRGAAGPVSLDVVVYGATLGAGTETFGVRALQGSEALNLALIKTQLGNTVADWVLIMDAGLRAERGAVLSLVSAMAAVPDAAAFGVVVADRSSNIATVGATVGLDASLQAQSVSLQSRFDTEAIRPIPAGAPGALLLARKTLVELSPDIASLAWRSESGLVGFSLDVSSRGKHIWLQPEAIFVNNGARSKHDDGRNWEDVRKRWQLVDRFSGLFAHAAAHACPVVDDQRRVILFLDAFLPRPDQDSGSLDAYWTIRLLSSFGYRVIFVAAFETSPEIGYVRLLSQLGVHVELPTNIQEFQRVVMAQAAGADLAYVQRVSVAQHVMESLRNNYPSLRLVFSTVDLHFLREERVALMAHSIDSLQFALHLRQVEVRAAALADAVVVVSRHEEELLRTMIPAANVHRLTLPRPALRTQSQFAQREGVLFIGGFDHVPNQDAATYLVKEIWPLVRKRLPNARLCIVGSRPTAEIMALSDSEQGVAVMGFVEDIEPVFDAVRLSVAPLRVGAGIKGKIASSLLHGVPCVASLVACEGMGIAAGREILVGRDAQELAAQIIELHENEALWSALADAGFEFAKQEFSVETFASGLRAVIKSAGQDPSENEANVHAETSGGQANKH